jgi:hypothetical protein
VLIALSCPSQIGTAVRIRTGEAIAVSVAAVFDGRKLKSRMMLTQRILALNG